MSSLADYRTKTQIIVDEVRARIVSGIYPPNERLVIRALADDFSVSDIPVREALRTLASEGLVSMVPYGGARVTALNREELIELTETRALVEPDATVRAAQRMTDADVEELRDVLLRMSPADLPAPDYGRLNREFHRAILRHCPNRTLYALIEDLWARAERGRAVHRLFETHRGTSLEHHERMLRSIRDRDLDALRRVAVEHAAHGVAAIRRLVDEIPDERRRAVPTKAEA